MFAQTRGNTYWKYQDGHVAEEWVCYEGVLEYNDDDIMVIGYDSEYLDETGEIKKCVRDLKDQMLTDKLYSKERKDKFFWAEFKMVERMIKESEPVEYHPITGHVIQREDANPYDYLDLIVLSKDEDEGKRLTS